SIHQTGGGLCQHFFDGASPGLRVGAGDKLFVYVYIDPAAPPKEIMLQWKTDVIKHRAYWGQNLIPFGTEHTPERRAMGALPAAAQWVRLEIDASHVGLNAGAVITGLTLTQYDGSAYFDKAGLVTQTPQGEYTTDSLSAWLKLQETYAAA